MWTETSFKQHIRNKSTACVPDEKLIVENDEIQNNSGEREYGQAIPTSDPTWYDTTDSNKNESDSSDDNNEYTQPTCNDSDFNVGVGYASFDNHNEAHPIDESIKALIFRNFIGMRQIMNLPK